MQPLIVTKHDVSVVLRDIEQLLNLLGRGKIKNAIGSWRKALKVSRGFLHEYHRYQFYWWPAFCDYFDNWQLFHAAPGLLLTPQFSHVLQLGQDARYLLELWPGMPESVRRKYLGTLVSREKAAAHVFEFGRAWHFHSQGMEIKWHEDNDKPGPEFVAAGEVELEVECKEFQPDTGRRIARRDFCQLGDEINRHLLSRKLMGDLTIVLDGALPSQFVRIKVISDEVGAQIKRGFRQGKVRISSGELAVDLQPNNDMPIDYVACHAEFVASKPDLAHSGLLAHNTNGQSCNPFRFTLMSAIADNIVESFYYTLELAAERQLSGTRPGVLCAYLPEVSDIVSLANSQIGMLAGRLFADPARSHLAAFIASSKHRRELKQKTVALVNDALLFKNTTCRFPGMTSFPFILPVDA